MMAKKQPTCDLIDLTTIDPKNITFEFEFDEFHLGTLEESEPSEDEDDEEFESEEDYGYLYGSGDGRVVVDDTPIAEFGFYLTPEDNVIVTVTKVLDGRYTHLGEIVKQWNDDNEAEFLGSEIDFLLMEQHHKTDSTLAKKYVG
jgi:hypothetical protein